MVAVTERIHPLFGARFFFIPSRAPKSRIKPVLIERLFEGLGFHHVGVLFGPMRNGADAGFDPVPVDIHDEVKAEFVLDIGIAEGDHLPEFPGRINVHQGEGRLPRRKRFAGQMQHDSGILADGVQHDRVVKLCRHLTNDVYALSLKILEVGEGVGILLIRGGLRPLGLHGFSFLKPGRVSSRPGSAGFAQPFARCSETPEMYTPAVWVGSPTRAGG